jgi:hypothetical protein
VDRRLREYARHRASLDAAEAFDLLRAEQLKLHFLHGFATMYPADHGTARPSWDGAPVGST